MYIHHLIYLRTNASATLISVKFSQRNKEIARTSAIYMRLQTTHFKRVVVIYCEQQWCCVKLQCCQSQGTHSRPRFKQVWMITNLKVEQTIKSTYKYKISANLSKLHKYIDHTEIIASSKSVFGSERKYVWWSLIPALTSLLMWAMKLKKPSSTQGFP